MKKYSLGTWRLTFDDGSKSLLVIKNNAQAKFIADNMNALHIKTWQAQEESTDKYYKI